jgi:integrase
MASVMKDYRYVNGDKVLTGRWRVAYRDPQGRQRTRVFKTAADAKVFAATTEVEVHRGTWVDPAKGKVTLRSYATDWLATVTARPNTLALYDYLLRVHILPAFGDTELRRITPTAVRHWHADMNRKASIGKSTVAKSYSLLRRIFTVAVDEGDLPTNPCKIKGGSREAVPEMKCPTPEQVDALAAAVPRPYRALVLLAGYGGLRWGEATALKRRNVDVEGGCVHVREQATEVDGKELVVSPLLKSAAGRRTVYLPDFVVDAVAVHLAEHVEAGPDALLFVAPRKVGGKAANQDQRYLRRNNFRQRVWLPATRAVDGCAGVRFHDLRHAAATQAAQTGATLKELMQHIGHGSAAAAMRYQHATDDRLRNIARGLDRGEQVAEATGNVVPIRRS